MSAIRLVCLFLLVLVFAQARAQTAPRWEAGIGFGTAYLPDYRGSDEESFYVVPWPYLVYRGERLNLDREGLEGTLFGSPLIKVVGSVGAATPVNSEQNETREGMSDLDFALEAGPMLEADLWRNGAGERLALQLPLRAVIVTDFASLDGIGWLFTPRLVYYMPHFRPGDLDLDITFGPLYASDDYHDYYYRVSPLEATASRPAYDASAGYSGSRLSVGFSKRRGKLWLGAYLRYDHLSGAVFEDSPLVRTRHALVFGTGLAYVITTSGDRQRAD